VDGDTLALRSNWPLAVLDAPALLRYCRFLAREAARMRRVHDGLTRDPSTFDIFAE
jgi:hypothetical protein